MVRRGRLDGARRVSSGTGRRSRAVARTVGLGAGAEKLAWRAGVGEGQNGRTGDDGGTARIRPALIP